MRKALIIGAGGLLGSAIHSQLQSEGAAVTIAQGIQWKDSAKAQKQLCDLLESFLLGSPSPSSQQNLRVEIFWCAGAGVIGTSVADLEKEVTLFEQVIDTLTSTLQDAISGTSFFYASSAGGVYAGSKNPPFTENSEPKPLSPYGESKLACERKLELLNAYNVKVVIGRFTNIYGPGQNISKPQGLISQICLAHHRGLHSKIYVSLDTLRDYVFVRDAAFMSLRLMDYVSTLDQASTTIKIIGSGTATTIAELMGIAKALFRHFPHFIQNGTALSAMQASDIRAISIIAPQVDAFTKTPLPVGFMLTNDDIGRRFRLGVNQYPSSK